MEIIHRILPPFAPQPVSSSSMKGHSSGWILVCRQAEFLEAKFAYYYRQQFWMKKLCPCLCEPKRFIERMGDDSLIGSLKKQLPYTEQGDSKRSARGREGADIGAQWNSIYPPSRCRATGDSLSFRDYRHQAICQNFSRAGLLSPPAAAPKKKNKRREHPPHRTERHVLHRRGEARQVYTPHRGAETSDRAGASRPTESRFGSYMPGDLAES